MADQGSTRTLMVLILLQEVMLKSNGLVFGLLKVAPGGNGVEIRGGHRGRLPSKPIGRFQDVGMAAIQRLHQRLEVAVGWFGVFEIAPH